MLALKATPEQYGQLLKILASLPSRYVDMKDQAIKPEDNLDFVNGFVTKLPRIWVTDDTTH